MVAVAILRKENSLTATKDKTAREHTARYQAMRVLSRAMTGKQFLNDGIQTVISHSDVDDQDTSLFTTLAYGTMQRHYTLERILLRFVERPHAMKRWTRELLLESLYQFYYLDHIPNHAIVDEAVSIAKMRGNKAIAGFVNGVLRRVMREATDLEAVLQSLADDEIDYCSLKYSLPMIWYDYFRKRWGNETADKIAESLNEPAPINIRFSELNALSEHESVARIAQQGVALAPSEITPHVYRVLSGDPIQQTMFHEGRYTIQDASAALAVEVLDPQPGEHVLDACAAPGGKTVQLAEKVGASGQIVACDIDVRKLDTIRTNIKRMHVADRVAVSAGDARRLPDRFEAASFDRILIDAPCSGIGLFRRKPDTKYNKQLEDLQSLQAIQLAILDAAVGVLKPGGTLVYSTCTITEAENHEVISQFLNRHPEMRIAAIPETLEKPLRASICTNGTIEILPHQYHSDGFFIAKLVKQK